MLAGERQGFMSQALYVPDDLYRRLVEVARARGQSAEDLLRAILTDAIEHENRENVLTTQSSHGQEPPEDPLAPFIGAFHFGVGDLAAHHDTYLANAYENQDSSDDE